MSWPKAFVRLTPPSPYKPGVYTTTVIGYDHRATRGVDGKVKLTDGVNTKEASDFADLKDWKDPWKLVQEPVLWVKLRLPWPVCDLRFEVPMSDVVSINTEAANHYNIHDEAKVIAIGYAADQKLYEYQKSRSKEPAL